MRWHHQWIILHEFLPGLVGPKLANQVLQEGPRWFRPGANAFIPLEFADAAYRYGHAQIRHHYRLNSQTDPVPLFPDLLGFRPVRREHAIDWTLFFGVPEATTAQRCKKIDGKLVRALIELPVAVTGECEIEDYHSLAVRDLQRGQGTGLPSDESLYSDTWELRRSRQSKLGSLPRAGMARRLFGFTFCGKLTYAPMVISSVPLAAGLWPRCWLD